MNMRKLIYLVFLYYAILELDIDVDIVNSYKIIVYKDLESNIV